MSDRPDMNLTPDAKGVLDDYLRTISFRSKVYYRGQVCEDWSMDISGTGQISFHVVCYGDCWFRLPGLEEPQRLHEGDVVVLPHDAPHLLSSTPDLPAEYGKISIPHQTPLARTGPGTALVCGYLLVDRSAYGLVFAMLPDHLIIRGRESATSAHFRALIDMLFSEAQGNHIGATAVLDRLADALMFYVIRHSVERNLQSVGLLAALTDKHIRSALIAICNEPSRSWTLDALADTALLSRSGFAERFRALVGKAPMEFLTDWRMQLARGWLERDRHSVAEVAARCGYQSEAAFSKAFKRIAGVGPGEFRRARRVRPDECAPPTKRGSTQSAVRRRQSVSRR